MQLYLCEKPSQGRDIAKVLGADQIGYGYMSGKDVTVTWGFGHLMEAAPPEAYDSALVKWRLDTLPILPDTWRMRVKADAARQFELIVKLLAQASEVVIATDADREGEMIAREILEYCKYQGSVKRLWLSALDEASIKKAIAELKDGATTYPLYQSALACSRADWLVGMNLSRLFTLIAQQKGFMGVLSVGRVQTPTLKLVVDREREIVAFVPKPYATVTVMLTFDDKTFTAHWVPPAEATDEAGHCCNMVRAVAAKTVMLRQGMAKVVEVKVNSVTEPPPLPFELSQLQAVCSAKLRLGAQETLNIAQALYETHKAITYPRTDCPFLPESIYHERIGVLRGLMASDNELLSRLGFIDNHKKSRAWNDRKVAASAHHAIIPTGITVDLEKMSAAEVSVYTLIRNRYLAQFASDFIFETVDVTLACGNETLKATGRSVKQSGWKELVIEQRDDVPKLPELARGDTCLMIDAVLEEKMTKPPPHYTEGTLLTAMKNIGRTVTDPRLKAKLDETAGIGTSATRGAIIQGLIDRRFLEKHKNMLVAMPCAFELIDAVPASIANPETTALWEQALEKIARGEKRADAFVDLQKKLIAELVKRHKVIAKDEMERAQNSSFKCPNCGKPMLRRRSKRGEFWGCSRFPECHGTIFDGGSTQVKPPVLTRGVIRQQRKKEYTG